MPALVYDRFGYGKSSKLKNERNETYLEKEAKEDLPILLIKLGFHDRNKILIGHSDGGSIALIYASQFPERTYAVITEAAHTFVEHHTIKGVKPVADLFENGGLKEKLTKYHGENTESMFYGWYNVWSSKKFSKWNIESYLSKIKCYVLAIQGKDDEYGTFKQLESIQTHIGNNRIKILFIDNCAHTPHVHFKEYVSEMMIKFIKDL
ncbi:MAG: alpha/beta hydrolase [Marinilabiliales bacterium]|nr:MAG: alpha/beta hydrolase [Marinilabiliales bacterium]